MAFARLSAIVALALGATQIANAAVTKRVTCSTGQVTANAACCGYSLPGRRLPPDQPFDGAECGEEAHSALRIAFHDAIGFSIHGGKEELQFHANGGIDDIVASQFPVFQALDLTPGDFIHLAAAVGTANCPGAPQLEFFFGRPPPLAPAPDLTVPEPTDTVTAILERFADAGFAPDEAVALLSSHTIAAADVVDVLLKGTAFPGNGSQAGEVLSPLAGEMRLQSDFRISQDPRTACLWQAMVDDQTRMQTQFKAAMSKLQVLGQNTRKLIDCSDVCNELRFPNIATVAGPAPTVAPIPGS
ncbi:manganese peroxidase 1 [Pholiota molesta]|nr:manganese peroxidase 1 [Pholiota molesta]